MSIVTCKQASKQTSCKSLRSHFYVSVKKHDSQTNVLRCCICFICLFMKLLHFGTQTTFREAAETGLLAVSSCRTWNQFDRLCKNATAVKDSSNIQHSLLSDPTRHYNDQTLKLTTVPWLLEL